jgi:hypothetical protein
MRMAMIRSPFRHFFGDKLRSIIATDKLWHSAQGVQDVSRFLTCVVAY